MSANRRLLIFLPFAPRLDAIHGGGRVIAQFLCEITKHYQVAILYFRSPFEPPIDVDLRNRCELVEEVLRQEAGKSLPLRLLHGLRLTSALAQLRPMWVADWSSQTYLNRARSIVRQFKPAIIQAEFHIMGQYLLALEDCPAPQVVVEHEPGIRAAAYLRNVPPFLQEVTHRLEKLAWMRYERALFHQVNAIVAFTAGDREAIQHISGGTPVFVIPPGIQIPERPLDPLGQLPPSLLFIGNFIHPPNVEAASILARDIFPLVQERFSETRLYIVGDQPPAEVRRFANANIVVTGRVSDVTHYLDQAALFVAPMRSGGGIRIKVMEAVIAGKAVVATRLAVEGLSLADGKEVSIADQDSEIVGRILDLLEHPDKRKTLAENARAWAIANLSWEKSIQRYEALYENLQ